MRKNVYRTKHGINWTEMCADCTKRTFIFV